MFDIGRDEMQEARALASDTERNGSGSARALRDMPVRA